MVLEECAVALGSRIEGSWTMYVICIGFFSVIEVTVVFYGDESLIRSQKH